MRWRGKHSRQTPDELVAIGDRVGFDGSTLTTASRLIAKIDSAAVQDGFQLYLHGFIVTDDGHWVIVQQGMNGEQKEARRYHWLSEGLTAGKHFVIPPRSNRKTLRTYDAELYKERHLIENFFARLEHHRALATRHDKTARNFLAAVYLAAATIWLN